MTSHQALVWVPSSSKIHKPSLLSSAFLSMGILQLTLIPSALMHNHSETPYWLVHAEVDHLKYVYCLYTQLLLSPSSFLSFYSNVTFFSCFFYQKTLPSHLKFQLSHFISPLPYFVFSLTLVTRMIDALCFLVSLTFKCKFPKVAVFVFATVPLIPRTMLVHTKCLINFSVWIKSLFIDFTLKVDKDDVIFLNKL